MAKSKSGVLVLWQNINLAFLSYGYRSQSFLAFVDKAGLPATTLKSEEDQICTQDAASTIIETEYFFHLSGFFVNIQYPILNNAGPL